MLWLNLPAAVSYHRNYTALATAGAEKAYKALAIKMSLSIENGLLITGIKKKKRTAEKCSKQARAHSEFVTAI